MVTVNVAQSPPGQTQKNTAEANLLSYFTSMEKKPLETIRFRLGNYI